MAIVAYSQQDEFDLVNSGQDCMGWTVVDQAGNAIGKVTEMLIETDQMKVDSIMVSGGVRIAAENFALRDGRVVVSGVKDDAQYAETQRAAATTTTAASQTYEPMTRGASAGRNIAGVTREASEGEITLPIIEEQMTVGKRAVEKGGVNVRTTMTEKPIEESVTLREEQVHVERHAVNRPVDAGSATEAFKEGTFEVTTQAEVPVVSKEARVVEEVVINKEMSERAETVRDTVKRTDVEVDEINTADARNRGNG